ncbi:prenyltransferase/squalene oxidase repeat-containing protein [Thiohalocapsa sp. ML1]|uniref:prenyltransferase/squalene oxidase repeat-containing protein n=1 Tax=Thiohalocapsa sp. ML1 TaxID=1431688 RepID=UPI0007321932|nr:prenyltransferase/squalene oxidase repeat-containing protein [Thiohalocapsa sp. ML1]
MKFVISSLLALLICAVIQPQALAEDAPATPAEPISNAAPAAASPALPAELRSKVKRAIDDGLRYLREAQADDGSWSDSVGVTALALRAYLESPRGYTEADGPFITRPIAYLLAHVKDDGSISETNHNRNYNTAVSITALAATGNDKFADSIANAQQFLAGLQLDDADGYERDHKYYGGIGYGGDERPDLSNMYMALEALKATDFDPDDPVWEKALVFVSRNQNNSETNDVEISVDDGGFSYMPNYSPHGGGESYGGMTSAGLLSLLFAGVDKTDPRVQAAYDWIRANYTLETNPNAKEGQGLFYYYNAFAKAMAAYGEPTVTDTDGKVHDWRRDLAEKLLSLQRKDGAWVNTISNRWWEGDPNLVTAWSIIALNHVYDS